MCNVLKPGEVFHYFANKVQDSGRCGNTSFALPRAYSYGACIGRHYDEGVALSNRQWSITTARHQSDLKFACQHLKRVYVFDPESVNISYRSALIDIEGLLQKASVARTQRDDYLGEALSIAEDFNTFARWNKSELHISPPVVDAATLEAIAQGVRVERAMIREAKRERAEVSARKRAEEYQAWREGQPVHLGYGNVPMMLRVKDEFIETSWGARIPLDQAPSIWRLIQRVMRGERDYEAGQSIGVYRLTKIRRDGSLVVGCHDIPYSEIEGIAKTLNLIGD